MITTVSFVRGIRQVSASRTGALLDPPAMDALPRFATRVAQGRVFVSMSATKSESRQARATPGASVIVGAGAAGASAAQALRETGFGGRILMLDCENRVCRMIAQSSAEYFLSGQSCWGEKSPLQTQEWYRRHGIERRTAIVVSVDPTARLITCADGTVVAYDAALLAVGGEPRRPPIPRRRSPQCLPASQPSRCRYAILAQAERSRRAVILGSSFYRDGSRRQPEGTWPGGHRGGHGIRPFRADPRRLGRPGVAKAA